MFRMITYLQTINTVFSAEDNYLKNRKNNFVTFDNDLYIPLNSNRFFTICHFLSVTFSGS